jgi:hypothetical protein
MLGAFADLTMNIKRMSLSLDAVIKQDFLMDTPLFDVEAS